LVNGKDVNHESNVKQKHLTGCLLVEYSTSARETVWFNYQSSHTKDLKIDNLSTYSADNLSTYSALYSVWKWNIHTKRVILSSGGYATYTQMV